MPGKFRVFIDGRELTGFTSARLSRSKSEMTGSLSLDFFFNYVPERPVVVDAARGREITVYVGSHLAFVGKLDKRKGRSIPAEQLGISGADVETSISKDGYSVTLTARGKTKYFMDSSHQHPTTNIKKTTNREVIQKLIETWGIELDWQAEEVKLPIVRLNDGGRVVDEIHKISNETCNFVYETRDGKLRVIDRPGTQMGVDLILGQNILTFSAEQSEDQANSDITVKGQRSDPEVWGEDAVLDRVRTVKDGWVTSKIPLVIQAYGDATDEALERRGKFEADKRASQSKKVNIDVFDIIQTNGQPWDIGLLHYVECPPEGVFDVFECVGLTYTIDAQGTLKTSLELAPPPSGGISGGAGQGAAGLLSVAVPGFLDAIARGVARRRQLGVTLEPTTYPASWGAADLSSVVLNLAAQLTVPNVLLSDSVKQPPPLTLPDD